MRHPTRPITIAIVVLVATSAPAIATTGGPIEHDQAFVGSVNGLFHHATIAMACFGPVQQGQTGHPMAGQMLEVLSPPPPVVAGPIHPGDSGSSATRIVAILRGLPSVVLARFKNYFQSKEIPTSAELPCAGTGIVRFVPRPASSSAKPAWVSVSFAGQP